MRLFENPTFNFLKGQKIAYGISAVLFVASLFVIFTKGLQYGIDFRGGIEFVVSFDEAVPVNEARETLTEPLGTTPEVKRFGSPEDLLIRIDSDEPINQVSNSITGAFSQAYPDNELSVIKTDVVGPRFAEDLRNGAIQSILFAILVIFVYILIRFKNWIFSAGAVVALIHDVVITMGIFTFFSEVFPFNMQIDQAIIAAFLTIVGYSLNDTVVVFDRVRENSLLYKTMDYGQMVNKSLNNTLSRTVITSLTTFFVILILFLFGGEVLKGFSFALIIGIILGTYSSLFIASSLLVEVRSRKQKETKTAKA